MFDQTERNEDMKYLLVLAMLCIATTGFALEDTPANRTKQAERYLKVAPPETMMEEMSEKMAANMPSESRTEFKKLLTKHLNVAAITKAMKDAMVKHFSADELKALADFYGSPLGKSAMKKFGAYMADAMPTVQAEILKAQEEAMKAQENASRQKQNQDQ